MQTLDPLNFLTHHYVQSEAVCTAGRYVTPGERVEMLLTAAYTINFLVFVALVGAGYTMRRRARDGEEVE